MKIKLSKLFSYWRVFCGMVIGGFGSVLLAVLIPAVFSKSIYILTHDVYVYFIIGMLGLGLFIGGLWQQAFLNEIEEEKNKKRTYNVESIFLNSHNFTPEQRQKNKKFWYKRQGSIIHYNDELTPTQKEEIMRQYVRVEELKQRLNQDS